MTHLNIQQGLNIEVVSTNLIKKLYEAALSVPEPLEGELDAAYMSGNLLVAKTYRSLVEYLTNRFDDLHINVTDGYYIPFTDPEVEKALALSIGDGIGITNDQINNITSINGTGNFSNIRLNTNITSFVELMEFSNLTSFLNAPFYRCTNLKKIGLPGNILSCADYDFEGVPLNKIIFKNTINNYFMSYFGTNSCPTLADLAHENRRIDLCIDAEDNVIESVTIPYNVNSTLKLCNTTIKSITFLSGTTSISDNFIEVSHELESVIIPEGVTYLGGANFYGCPKLKFIDIPSTISRINQYTFGGSTYLNTMVCRATTPPTVENFVNLYLLTSIYVPDDSVEIYKTTHPWSNNASVIYPLSQYIN